MSFPFEQPHVLNALILQTTAHCRNPDDKQCKSLPPWQPQTWQTSSLLSFCKENQFFG